MVTKNNANRELVCKGVNGITDIFCEQDASNELLLKLKLNTVSQATGLYKIQLTNEQEDDEDWKDGDPIGGLRNALSLRGSSNFGTIVQKTKDDYSVSSYTSGLTVLNDYAAGLLYLGSFNITQTTKDYSTEATYQISFEPFSKIVNPDTNNLKIQLAYPNSVMPVDTENACVVTGYSEITSTGQGTGRTFESDSGDCKQLEGSRIFSIENAIKYGFDAQLTIEIKFINPVDNWGEIGFKIKTYEMLDDGTTYLVDMLEENALIPNLKCTAPCKYCYEENNVVLDMEYCTSCW